VNRLVTTMEVYDAKAGECEPCDVIHVYAESIRAAVTNKPKHPAKHGLVWLAP